MKLNKIAGATLALALGLGSALLAPAGAFAEDAPVEETSAFVSDPVVVTETEESVEYESAPAVYVDPAPVAEVVEPVAPAAAKSIVSPIPPVQKSKYITAVWYAEGTNQWPEEGQTLTASQKQKDPYLDVDFVKAAAAELGCGFTIQGDLYNDDKVTKSLLDGGKLYGPSNPTESWPGGSYKSEYSTVFYTGDCAPGEPNGAASIEASCAAAAVTVTNALDGKKERLTASFVVYVDGEFFEALVALGGETVTGTPITFAEDSGSHIVQVRAGPAQGDALLAEANVLSDCVLPADERETRLVPLVDCEAEQVVLNEEERTRSYSYVDGVATPGDWSEWTPTGERLVREASDEDLDAAECPLPELPADDVRTTTSESGVICGDTEVAIFTETWTTPYKYVGRDAVLDFDNAVYSYTTDYRPTVPADFVELDCPVKIITETDDNGNLVVTGVELSDGAKLAGSLVGAGALLMLGAWVRRRITA